MNRRLDTNDNGRQRQGVAHTSSNKQQQQAATISNSSTMPTCQHTFALNDPDTATTPAGNRDFRAAQMASHAPASSTRLPADTDEEGTAHHSECQWRRDDPPRRRQPNPTCGTETHQPSLPLSDRLLGRQEPGANLRTLPHSHTAPPGRTSTSGCTYHVAVRRTTVQEPNKAQL